MEVSSILGFFFSFNQGDQPRCCITKIYEKIKEKGLIMGEWSFFFFLPRNQIRPNHHVMCFLICHKLNLNHTIFSRFDITNPKFVSISHRWFLGFKEHMGSDLSKLLLFISLKKKQLIVVFWVWNAELIWKLNLGSDWSLFFLVLGLEEMKFVVFMIVLF